MLALASGPSGLRALAGPAAQPKRRRTSLRVLAQQREDAVSQAAQRLLGVAVAPLIAAPLLLGAPAVHAEEAAAPPSETAQTAEQPTLRTALIAGGLSGIALFAASTVLRNGKQKDEAPGEAGEQGKAAQDAEAAARLAELKRQMAEAEGMNARAGELQGKTSELRGALDEVMSNLEDVRRARLAAEAELQRLSMAAAQAAAAGAAPASQAAQRDEALELRRRQEEEAEAQWAAADARFQKVLGQLVEEQGSMDSEDEADALKARFLDVLDELHAERERAAILQYKWLEEEGEAAASNGAGPATAVAVAPAARQAAASRSPSPSPGVARSPSPAPSRSPSPAPGRSPSPSPAAAHWDHSSRASAEPERAASRSPSPPPAQQSAAGWDAAAARAGGPPPGLRWTDPQFAEQVLAAFPAKAVATVEEARCLLEKGRYTYLDVRPVLELEDVGRVPGAVNIPLVQAERVFNPASGKREVEEWDNEHFVAQVRWRFPDLDTPLVVGDSDGGGLAVEALEILEDEGYTCLVGLKGGFWAWTQVFDSKGARRSRSTSAPPPRPQR